MGRDAAVASPAAREIFERADAVLGLPLSRICFEPSGEDELLRTEIQQPAILTVSVALLRALEEQTRLEPVCVAGHSLGEYTALVAAGALPFEDAVRIVHARGRYMQEAVPEGQGAMAAVIGCAPDVVEQACAIARSQTGRVVAPANYNGPQQTVISGEAAAVEIACARARQEGAKRTVPLAVSAPFHCALMAPAAEKLAPELSRVHFEDPRPPVVTNVEARANGEASRIPELLRAQVTEPVRFTEMIREMARLGVTRVLEIGPGRVLAGLVRRIDPALARANLSVADELPEAARFAVGAA
jgi:[acyl-carrier-protein] S-malonyltransferase